MAKKAKGLPFVVKPRLSPVLEKIGNEDIGVFEIERRGYLTVAEKAFAQATNADDDSIVNIQTLTSKICRETGHSRDKVMEDIVDGMTADYLEPYSDALGHAVGAMSVYDEKMKFIRATALIYSRIDSDWTVEQTLELDELLVNELAELYADEERRDTTAIEASISATEGVEKKGKS